MPDLTPQGRQDFNGIRGNEPRVTLRVGASEAILVTRYTLKVSVLTQPAACSITMGTSESLARLLHLIAPNTSFSLDINGRRVLTGRVDGVSTQGTTGILTLEGRDLLSVLHDAYLLQEKTYKDDTYAALVRKVMNDVGLGGTKLVYANTANRKAVVGLASETKPTRNVETLSEASGQGGKFQKHVQSQLGERGYEFLKRHLDRAGLFLWCGADGTFILSEPNPNQAPLYRLQRSDGDSIEFSDIVDSSFQNRTTERFSEVHVYTRGEQKRKGRSTTIGKATDDEMVAWGFRRTMILRDANADTEAKAQYMAKRKIAESRRAGWRLSYTVAGHVTGGPLTVAGSSDGKGPVRPIWYPDTIVEVDDAKYGISGLFWVEGVTFSCGPQATTQLDLMRPEDLVFGDNPPPPASPFINPLGGPLPSDLAI